MESCVFVWMDKEMGKSEAVRIWYGSAWCRFRYVLVSTLVVVLFLPGRARHVRAPPASEDDGEWVRGCTDSRRSNNPSVGVRSS
jgi:hypothetical protein